MRTSAIDCRTSWTTRSSSRSRASWSTSPWSRTDRPGQEKFRRVLFGYRLDTIEPGLDGRNRYTLVRPGPPDNVVAIERDPNPFPGFNSRNPATDTRVEIESISHGQWPVVEHDATNHTLTMTFDYAEGGGIWKWVEDVAEGREQGRKALSVIDMNGDTETGRTNDFECFPIRYEQFTGFGQVEKIKERVVIAYGFSERG